MVKTAAWSVLPAWLLAIAGVLAVGLTPARLDWLVWLPLACGVSVVLALALQVSTRQPQGFVWRASVAVCGVALVYAVGGLILWLVVR